MSNDPIWMAGIEAVTERAAGVVDLTILDWVSYAHLLAAGLLA